MNHIKFSKRYFSRRNVVIVSGKRTPIGCFMGILQNFAAPSLGSIATRGALAGTNVESKDIEELIYGNVF